LASLPSGVALLVLDAGSRDRTREIARAAGATVLERPWSDFVDARRFALRHVTTPWTFMLDADERLDSVLRDALVRADPEAEGVDAYRVRRATRFCGEVVRAFGWDDERLIRVFRTDRAALAAHPAGGGSASLHERWSVAGRVGDLDGRLVHDSYPDRAAYARKFARYTSLEAAGLTPAPGALARTALLAFGRFLWLLGPRGGLRMGWRGAYLAFWSALYPVVVQWKARLRSRGGK
jgi:glycosyltransferase involved in cell wall biosynthesis